MLSKRQAQIFFVGGTVFFSAIFLLLTADSMIRVPEQTNESRLTAAAIAGKHIWEENNCMGCHTLFGEGAYYAPELTNVVARRGIPWIKVFLKDPQAMFPGRRKMVQYDFSEQEVDEIIAFLDWCGQVDLNGFPPEPPLRAALAAVVAPPAAAAPSGVAPKRVAVPEIFTSGSCLGCHQLQGQGGAAAAAIGAPPLDDVYRRKSRAELIEWIKNPQKVKPGTAMPALVGFAINEQQVDEIVDFLLSLDPSKGAAETARP